MQNGSFGEVVTAVECIWIGTQIGGSARVASAALTSRHAVAGRVSASGRVQRLV